MEDDGYTQSSRVRGILNNVAVGISLRVSERYEGTRTRSRLEVIKENAAEWLETLFWCMRWFGLRGQSLPSEDTLVDFMLRIDHFTSDDEEDSFNITETSEGDIKLAEWLIRAVEISIVEQH